MIQVKAHGVSLSGRISGGGGDLLEHWWKYWCGTLVGLDRFWHFWNPEGVRDGVKEKKILAGKLQRTQSRNWEVSRREGREIWEHQEC